MTHKPSYEELERRVQELEKEMLIRTRAVEALRENEERFLKFFRASPVGISIARLNDSQFCDVNDAYLDILGYTREEVIDHNPIELRIWADPEERIKIVTSDLKMY